MSPRFLFCSSIASVLNGLGAGDTVYEKLSEDPATAVPIGYSQSKWVTEQICALANESAALKDRVSILRIGQLCGDTAEGIWNGSEGWPLMIKTAETTGTLPVLQEVGKHSHEIDHEAQLIPHRIRHGCLLTWLHNQCKCHHMKARFSRTKCLSTELKSRSSRKLVVKAGFRYSMLRILS